MMNFKVFAVLTYSIFTIQICGCGNSSDPDIRYVALGASDAVGIGATSPGNGYVSLIEDDLAAHDKKVSLINLGIPGADAGAIEDTSLSAAKRANADLITVWTGSNDIIAGVSPEDFRRHVDSILKDLSSDPDVFIVIGDIPDLTALPRYQETKDPDVTKARVAAFNVVIDDEAALYNVPVAKISSVASSSDLVSDQDGFHPNNQGYEKIAQIFLEIIDAHFFPSN